MYKRLTILSVIILAALCAFFWMGYHSIAIRAQGMEGARLGEFAAVAEQIRLDVKRKLDDFLRTEQNRPYTDYQPYYVPDYITAPGAAANQQQMPVLRSPLLGSLEHGLAYGHFQIQPDGSIITPNDNFEQKENLADPNSRLYAEVPSNRKNIEDNLLPKISALNNDPFEMNLYSRIITAPPAIPPTSDRTETGGDKGKLFQNPRAQNYPVESLQNQQQQTQVVQQERSILEQNEVLNIASSQQQPIPQASVPQSYRAETVLVRIEPFVSLIVPGGKKQESIFGGQVFLLRGVQIQDRHFLQGFQLNENRLIDEVKQSASQFMREGMDFDLLPNMRQNADENVAYTAALDFGFGDLVLNMKETDPNWIRKEISHIRNWYFGIAAVVLLAVSLGLGSLWNNAHAQMVLAQKKDDFLSAVSHELRTPLTSIRMYAEMLEKNWLKSPDKAAAYYSNMRQESERLGRLIENVLDFSRIQKGRKSYAFNSGDINNCVAGVVEVMKPYVESKGFIIEAEYGRIAPIAFDSDAVTQTVVNLLDNAIKYSPDAEDKTVKVRTKSEKQFILIEVEDHGPGIPHRQRDRIFEQFYRLQAEATRETTGTGLGLALVKKFAEAHGGFVEVLDAKPTGTIFRVAVAARV